MKNRLTSDNFFLYVTKMYDNPTCSGLNEFYEDMSRIKYIKRLLLRFKKGGDLKERLVLNHIIILQNLLGVEATVRILFFKLSQEIHSQLKSFFVYLEYLPVYCPEVPVELIQTDHRVDKILRELK